MSVRVARPQFCIENLPDIVVDDACGAHKLDELAFGNVAEVVLCSHDIHLDPLVRDLSKLGVEVRQLELQDGIEKTS